MITNYKQFPVTTPYTVNGKPQGDLFKITEVCKNVITYKGPRLPNVLGKDYSIKCVEVHGYHGLYELTVEAREGYVFDGASVPRLLWWVGHPMSPRFQRAALIHDILYGFRTNRMLNDELFYQLLLEDGVNRIRAKAMYAAVRVGGWFYYKYK